MKGKNLGGSEENKQGLVPHTSADVPSSDTKNESFSVYTTGQIV